MSLDERESQPLVAFFADLIHKALDHFIFGFLIVSSLWSSVNCALHSAEIGDLHAFPDHHIAALTNFLFAVFFVVLASVQHRKLK